MTAAIGLRQSMTHSLESQFVSSRQAMLLCTGAVCLIASVLVAVLMVALQGGFGAGDMWSFLFWTLPFAVGMAVVGSLSMKLFCRLSFFIRYSVAALSGGLLGFIWTFIVALVLGPWFGAFSFPVLLIWAAGGASGMISSTGACKGRKKGHLAIEVTLIVSICLFAAIGTKPLFALLASDQKLEVVLVKWKPGPDPLSVRELGGSGLNDQELAQLKSTGITGKLDIVGISIYGSGEHSRALIVVHHQVDDPVKLPQPDKAEVIYIQNGNDWKTYPSNVPTLKRVISLKRSKQDPRDTMCEVELANGAVQGGLAFSW